MESHMAEPLQGSHNWNISKDAFAPPTARRIVRGWDRAPVSAYAPRLHGIKVWKKLELKTIDVDDTLEDAQKELAKEGTGARKKSRMIGAKENIGDAVWEENSAKSNIEYQRAENERNAIPLEVEASLGTVASMPETAPTQLVESKLNGMSSTQETYAFPAELQFVPRKRTNSNRVVTPKKTLRQTTLNIQTQTKPPMESPENNTAIRLPRRRKSIRKSFRRATIGSLVEQENVHQQPDISSTVEQLQQTTIDQQHPIEPNADVEAPVDGRRSVRRSTRVTRAGTVHVEPQVESHSIVVNRNQQTLADTTSVAEEPARRVPSRDLPGCSVHSPDKMSVFLGHTQISRSGIAAVDVAERNRSADLENDLKEPAEVQAIITDGEAQSCPKVQISPESCTGASEYEADRASDQSANSYRIVSKPGEPSKIVLPDNESRDMVSAHKDPPAVEPILSKDQAAEKASAPFPQKAIQPVLVQEATTCGMTGFDIKVPEIEVIGVTKGPPILVTQGAVPLIASELTVESVGEVAEADSVTNDLLETISSNASAVPSYDHDDTDMLRNFLTRVKANKAAKIASPRRKRSLPHSPLRIPLGDVDNNLSPSPLQPKCELNLAESSPSKRGNSGDSLATEDDATAEPKNCRRSGRTRIPTKAPLGAPSFIPVRRLGQESDTTVTLKRSEEKELAALTRVNTRKNKAGALSALEVLAKKADEKEDPVMRQRLLKEVFDEKEKGKQDKDGKGKGKKVAWAEELAKFQEFKSGKSQTKIDDKVKEVTQVVPEEKKQGTVRVGVRSKMALGMAVNGTPAPKRRMRGHV